MNLADHRKGVFPGDPQVAHQRSATWTAPGAPIAAPRAYSVERSRATTLIFGSRLADQYATARVELGFSDVELAGLARSSLAASRATGSVRAAAERDIERWLGGPGG